MANVDYQTQLANLVQHLKQNGALTSEAVEEALHAVPRHHFLPSHQLEEIYADRAIMTRSAPETMSSCSQPAIVTMMLEMLRLQPGHRVLEIGAGTGWNAALMGHLVGDSGSITTIDINSETADEARDNVKTAGASNVQVHCGDGGSGYAPGAPYDRIVATAQLTALTPHLIDQLAIGGLLVAPLSVNTMSMVVRFQKILSTPAGGILTSTGSIGGGFMPLRGQYGDDTVHSRFGSVGIERSPTCPTSAEQIASLLEGPRRDVQLPALQGGDSHNFLEFLAWRGAPLLRLHFNREEEFVHPFAYSTADTSVVLLNPEFNSDEGRYRLSPSLTVYGTGTSLESLHERIAEWERAGRPGALDTTLVIAPTELAASLPCPLTTRDGLVMGALW